MLENQRAHIYGSIISKRRVCLADLAGRMRSAFDKRWIQSEINDTKRPEPRSHREQKLRVRWMCFQIAFNACRLRFRSLADARSIRKSDWEYTCGGGSCLGWKHLIDRAWGMSCCSNQTLRPDERPWMIIQHLRGQLKGLYDTCSALACTNMDRSSLASPTSPLHALRWFWAL